MAAIVEKAKDLLPGSGESKSARKKKAKAESDAAAANGANGSAVSPAAEPEAPAKADSIAGEDDHIDASGEHIFFKEYHKQIRSTNKKLQAMAKVDSILAENPGISLDDLVAQRKINQDQKLQAQKKPQLQAQLRELEERVKHYRIFEADIKKHYAKQGNDLSAQHEQSTSRLREELKQEADAAAQAELRKKLLTFSQFLRAAAAKRVVEEDQDTDESRAFEGALLLVYGGDHKAVDAAIALIEGSSDTVPSIEGIPTPITCESP